MLSFIDTKTIDPRMIQKQISKQLRISDSTIKRFRDDIQMDSPYNRNNYKRRIP